MALTTSTSSESLRPVDCLLLGYLSIVSIVALVRAPAQPGCWWLLVAHGLFVVLLFLLTRPGLGPVGRGIREVYPLILLAGLYAELDVLNGVGAGRCTTHWCSDGSWPCSAPRPV